tara:strand:+ start:37 stop:255 length:219 start_codon:yes stop_codon:yes gene_type:complete
VKTLNFGIEKQLDRIVETLALSALMASKPNKQIEKRLREIAFPLEIDIEGEPHYSSSDITVLFESEVIDDDL